MRATLLLVAAITTPLTAQRIELPGDSLYPEGIAIHQGTGEIFVGSVAGRSILRFDDGQVTTFKASGSDGLSNVIGMAVDSRRNRLWVASTQFIVDGAINISPALLPEAMVFDTRTSELLARFPIPQDGQPHFLNDVDIDDHGNALFTDSFAPMIWRVSADLDTLDPWLESPAFQVQPGFNLNGIAVAPSGTSLAVSIPGRAAALFLVDMRTREITRLSTEAGFPGGDGIAFEDEETLIGAVMGLWRIKIDRAQARATFERIEADLDFPTSVDLYDGRLFVVNSQLDHWVPIFNNDDPPSLPFTLSVILNED